MFKLGVFSAVGQNIGAKTVKETPLEAVNYSIDCEMNEEIMAFEEIEPSQQEIC